MPLLNSERRRYFVVAFGIVVADRSLCYGRFEFGKIGYFLVERAVGIPKISYPEEAVVMALFVFFVLSFVIELYR